MPWSRNKPYPSGLIIDIFLKLVQMMRSVKSTSMGKASNLIEPPSLRLIFRLIIEFEGELQFCFTIAI